MITRLDCLYIESKPPECWLGRKSCKWASGAGLDPKQFREDGSCRYYNIGEKARREQEEKDEG